MNQENQNNFLQSDDINFGRYLRLILMQSKIILFITLAGLILGISLYVFSPKMYKITSLLQVYSPGTTYDPRQSMSLDFFNAPETNLDNLVSLYTSRSNTINLIEDLNLNIQVEDLKDQETLELNNFLIKGIEEYNEKFFYLEIQGNFFKLLNDKKNILLEGANGEYLQNDNYEFQASFENLASGKLIKITYLNPSRLYNRYKNRLTVNKMGSRSNYWSQEGLINVNLITSDPEQGKKIINSANKIFINDNIEAETEKAKISIQFINTQLNALEEILNSKKRELKSFKEKNKSLNVDLETQSIIDLIADIELKINKVDLELSQAEVNFTSDNPLYINLRAQKEALMSQKQSIEQKIGTLPTAQQEYIDLFRNLESSEDLYSELVNRKLNFSIVEASTIGNIRVVDRAFTDGKVSPRLFFTFLFTAVSFLLGILIAVLRGMYFISITNPAELKDAGIKESIVGVIPKIENTNDPFSDKKFEQSLETSILNIETIITSNLDIEEKSNCRKILFTSATSSNGKSFISRNVSIGLSRIGHKVLLIDADLKRGDQHKFFNKESIPLSVLNNTSVSSIDSLKISDNLYLLPKLKRLKNTFEYLYGNLFFEKIKDFEGFFDYIIFDTAPALSVSDTSLLMSSSDMNFLITRHQVSRINEIRQTLQIINQVGRTFDGLIYNDYQKPRSYYGYYDLYGDYSYRYYAERYLYDDYYIQNNE